MEDRKRKEIEYYNKQAEEWLKEKFAQDWKTDFEGFSSNLLSSFQFCYKILGENCRNKKVLDYGCGNGIHSVFLAKIGAEKVTGIDLSESQLKIARERAKREGIEKTTEYLVMDCEKMGFSNNSFDIIFDGGTFSSLDFKKAIPELARVLKPEGFLLGIETFGHNPFTNLKRKLNRASGKRTEWAASHIFQIKDFELVKNYFNKIEIKYFHLISWAAFPFLNLSGGKILLNFLEIIDRGLLKIPFLRKYAFKVVFVFSQPKK